MKRIPVVPPSLGVDRTNEPLLGEELSEEDIYHHPAVLRVAVIAPPQILSNGGWYADFSTRKSTCQRGAL